MTNFFESFKLGGKPESLTSDKEMNVEEGAEDGTTEGAILKFKNINEGKGE